MSSYIATSNTDAKEISTDFQIITKKLGISYEDLNLIISPGPPTNINKDWAKVEYDDTKNIYLGPFSSNSTNDYYFNFSGSNIKPLFDVTTSKINVYGDITKGYKSNNVINVYKSSYQDYYKLIMGNILEVLSASITYKLSNCIIGCPIIICVFARDSISNTALNYTVTDGWTLLSKSPYGLYQFEGDTSFHTQIFVFTKIAQSTTETITFTNNSGFESRLLVQGCSLRENIPFSFNQKDGIDYWSEETVADNAHSLIVNNKPTLWICANVRWSDGKWSSDNVKFPKQNVSQPRLCLGVSNSLMIGEDHIFYGLNGPGGYKVIGSIAFDTDWLYESHNVWVNKLNSDDVILGE